MPKRELISAEHAPFVIATFCIALIVVRILWNVSFDLNSVYLVLIAVIALLIPRIAAAFQEIQSLKAGTGGIEFQRRVSQLEAKSESQGQELDAQRRFAALSAEVSVTTLELRIRNEELARKQDLLNTLALAAPDSYIRESRDELSELLKTTKTSHDLLERSEHSIQEILNLLKRMTALPRINEDLLKDLQGLLELLKGELVNTTKAIEKISPSIEGFKRIVARARGVPLP